MMALPQAKTCTKYYIYIYIYIYLQNTWLQQQQAQQQRRGILVIAGDVKIANNSGKEIGQQKGAKDLRNV